MVTKEHNQKCLQSIELFFCKAKVVLLKIITRMSNVGSARKNGVFGAKENYKPNEMLVS
jgi:hypothetical protein